jgi:poly(A) polymerase/tRNA nucleotidyltransferase (CCA-adding enzyme)
LLMNKGGVQEKEKIFSLPREVVNAAKTLENKGFEAYLVGGCVRDLLIDKKPKDWDIATNATPMDIIKIFPDTFYENDYGTVGVVNKEAIDESLKVIEITPYRLEGDYSNSRHPDSVIFSKNLTDDLKRRDFTVNAIALKIDLRDVNSIIGQYPDLYKGHIIDLFGGLSDIEKRILRTVGSPEDRFREDALRLIRAVRIATENGFTINHDTYSAISKLAKHLSSVSKERIRDEFSRILNSDRPMVGLEMLRDLNLLDEILPILKKSIGVSQNKAHAYDVWVHTLRTVQHAAKKGFSLEIRLAALFHDIGKPETRRFSKEKKDWTFYGHDVIGAKITSKALAELKYPNNLIDKVTKLVRWHMFFSDTEKITHSAVRRLIANVGRENVWDLMNLRICDRIGTGRPKEDPYRLRKYRAMIEEVMMDPIKVSMLKIGGNEVMKLTGINPGPKIGFILNALLEEVLDDPSKNTEDYLSNRVVELSHLSDEQLSKVGISAKEKRKNEEEKAIKQIRQKYWVK